MDQGASASQIGPVGQSPEPASGLGHTATVPSADPRLISDLKGLRAHHAFTRDRIGQPGCEVRKVAAEYVEIIDRAIAAVEQSK